MTNPARELLRSIARVFYFVTPVVSVLLFSNPISVLAQSQKASGAIDASSRRELEPPPGTYHLLSHNDKVIIPFEF